MTDDTGPIPPYIAQMFNQTPIPISIYDRDGFCVDFNDAHAKLWGIRREGWLNNFNMVTDPQLAATGSPAFFERVMQGEQIVIPPAEYDTSKSDVRGNEAVHRWVEAIYFPVRDTDGTVTHLGAILRDVTREMEQQRAIEAAQAEIAAQQDTIESLSTPVIQLWKGILLMPLIGSINHQRARAITANLLQAIADHSAQCVILDITGVPVIDTHIAQHLIQAAQACALLGSKVALVGIGVATAQTLVHLGVDLSNMVTLANLQAGIAWAFAQQRLSILEYDQTTFYSNQQKG